MNSKFPDLRPVNTEHPLFDAIWQAIKGWDIEREHGQGYAGATGTDVQIIIDLRSSHPTSTPLAPPTPERPQFKSRDDEMWNDLSINPQIPVDVMIAAVKVSHFFKSKGIKKWALHDLQSRVFECERPTSTPPDAGDSAKLVSDAIVELAAQVYHDSHAQILIVLLTRTSGYGTQSSFFGERIRPLPAGMRRLRKISDD